MRYGISDRVELRFGWDGYIWSMTDYQVVDELSGLGNVEVGAKFVLNAPEPESSELAAALLTGLTIPVGDDEVAADITDLSATLLIARDLSERAALGVNVGGTAISPFNDFAFFLRNTVSLGVSLSNSAGAFIETFGEYRVDASSETERWQAIDGGFTHAIGDNAQIDVSGGVGITKYAPDWFIGAGAALRVGK